MNRSRTSRRTTLNHMRQRQAILTRDQREHPELYVWRCSVSPQHDKNVTPGALEQWCCGMMMVLTERPRQDS